MSYGLTRDQLEDLNFSINNLDALPYYKQLLVSLLIRRKFPLNFQPKDTIEYTFTLSPSLMASPAVVFSKPLLVELVGAGFTKSANCMVRNDHISYVHKLLADFQYYELRFPRISRVYRMAERTWRDGVHLLELQEIALRCIGKDRPLKDVDDWCTGLWGKNPSPNSRSRLKRKASVDAWQHRLATLDGDFNPARTPFLFKESEMSNPRAPVTHDPDSMSGTLPQPPGVKQVQPLSGCEHMLRDALVWFPNDMDKTAWKEFIPPNRRLHTLESLLLGCGWKEITSRMQDEVKRGIAMVHSHGCREFVVDTLRKYKCDAHLTSSQAARRPILVVDTTGSYFGEDFESRVVFRLES